MSEPRNAPVALVGALILVALIGFFDYVTGTHLRLYPLYMVPIAMVTWRLDWWAGGLLSGITVAVWVVSKSLAGLENPPWIWIVNGTAHLTAFVTTVVLISFLRRSRAAERRLARIDPLTRLPNSRAFSEATTREIDRQLRHQRPMTIAFIDLDNFKTVNDDFGHRTGDRVLTVVAQALRSATRVTDHLARLGGDEFVVLMPETQIDAAGRVIARIQSSLSEAMAEGGWPVACSIGAVTFYERPRTVDEMIARADKLMYEVKAAGKNAARLERHPPLSAA